MLEKLHGTIKKHNAYHPAALSLIKARIQRTVSIKALRKKNLFSGIGKSKRFTIDAAHKAFAGVVFKK